jgi:hypothetical protein
MLEALLATGWSSSRPDFSGTLTLIALAPMDHSGGYLMPEQATTATNRWLDHVVWIVALWASFFNLLNFHGYPLFQAEVAIALLGFALVGAMMGAVQHLARPRLSFLFVALFTAVLIDINTSIELNWFYGLWAILTIIAFFIKDALLKIALASFSAVLLFQLFALVKGNAEPAHSKNVAQNLQTQAADRVARPAIVHLVLDSYLGLDGMALGPDEYRALRSEQTSFFTGQGFKVYPRAYSRHASTMESLPYLFSYGETSPVVYRTSAQYAVPEKLPYFVDLDKMGYQSSAVLPAYFDICVKQPLTHCRNFDSSALTSMLNSELGAADRAKVFGFTLVQLTNVPSRVAYALQLKANELLGTEAQWPFNRSKLYALASIREMDRFTDKLIDLRPGELRFAHLLLPHSPYLLNANCAVKPESEWLNEHGPGSEAARERAYADQVRCLQNRIARMLDVLDRTETGREAIVVIHGDHGSRIAPGQPFVGGPDLSKRQTLMTYSAFFAIRVPGEAAGEIPGTYALDELMADFRNRAFASAPRPKGTPPQVLLKDSDGNSRERRPLPSFAPDLSSL